ncbi:MAG: glycine betaine ABC transporter substrate-binding protein, partial [Acidobacteriota bacterium]
MSALLGALLVVSTPTVADQAPREVVVGSKLFTESVILGEAMTGLLRDAGVPARHRQELGGTRVNWNALRRGDIDAYPEYTGTIVQEILADLDLTDSTGATDAARLRDALAAEGIAMSAPLGFDNTYAIGVREAVADRLGVR